MKSVVFDLGNVLIPWDPRFLYRKLLPDEAAVERFLGEVCTAEWNLGLDAGRPWDEAVADLIGRYPPHAPLIRAYDERWGEMIQPAIAESVAILESLAAAGTPLYALTNWSTAKFNFARPQYPFLERFRDIVVSGEVQLIKPDPRIYRLLLERNGLNAADCVFIDDSRKNVDAAAALGLSPIHFRSPAQLRDVLAVLGVLPR